MPVLRNRFEPQQVGPAGLTVVMPILDGTVAANRRAQQVLKEGEPFTAAELQSLVGCLTRRADDLFVAAEKKMEAPQEGVQHAAELDQLMAQYMLQGADMIADAITQEVRYRDILLADHLRCVRPESESEHTYLCARLTEMMREETDSLQPEQDVNKVIVPRLAYEWNNAVAEVLGVERYVDAPAR